MTITSKDNEKLKLVRRLAERKHREREGLFVTEGEDLLSAGIRAGAEPRVLLSAAGAGLGGDEVERPLLDSVSQLGSGTRVIAVWPARWTDRPASACVFLDGIADPGNVGAIIRAADGFGAATVALDAASADPLSPKAVRASMGSVFAVGLVRCTVGDTPAPRAGLAAHGGAWPPAAVPATLCVGAERAGLSAETSQACEELWTIPLPGGAESLGAAAAATVALERISSAAAVDRAPGKA